MSLHRTPLTKVDDFESLVEFLRNDLEWPIDESATLDDLTFNYDFEELGLDSKSTANVRSIRQIRPLSANQAWGMFYIEFEPKHIPIVVLRRILRSLVVKKRQTAKSALQAAWNLHDLLFISACGEGHEQSITFAHFSEDSQFGDLPTLRVLGWDGSDTPLKLDHVASTLRNQLRWPEPSISVTEWRERWSNAFKHRQGHVIRTADALAETLAILARKIRDSAQTLMDRESDRGPLRQLYKAFQTALIHDLTPASFVDYYAQTITYGLLTAAISRTDQSTEDGRHATALLSENITDMVPVTNPFLREMLQTFLTAGGRKGGIDFDELGIQDVVELLRGDETDLPAILRDFGNRNPGEDPVIHFYEHFLESYDKKTKVKRGVFFTPQPVVSYIVRSVHELLQTEFGIEDGLASTVTWGEMAKQHPNLKIPPETGHDSPFVVVLDPATGTGTFLVEAIDVIYNTLVSRWREQGLSTAQQAVAWNDYVPKHLLTRLHGYELMMAPYAVAHMKIGLKLLETGYLFQSDERARIYLTNSLEPTSDINPQLPGLSPALAREAQAVNAIKRGQRFTVVMGNPPYAGISSNMTETARHLVDAYKVVDGKALNERKLWLQDDYVKFIRNAQTIIEGARVGVFGFITNNGYFGNPTFRGMRQSLMATFPRLQVLDLHGNANKKEQAPDGSEDKNVFDIRQGVGICLATRGGAKTTFGHADCWGSREAKYAWLTKHSIGNIDFSTLTPDSPYYFFGPQNTDSRAEYDTGWKINDAIPVNSAGFITARDHFVTDFDSDVLLSRIAAFADPNLSDAEIRATYFADRGSDKYPDGDTRGWKVPTARHRVQSDKKWSDRIVRCLYRPFDFRSVYWVDWMVDWPRPEVMGQMLGGDNRALLTARSNKTSGNDHFFCAAFISETKCAEYSTQSAVFPLYTFQRATTAQSGLALGTEKQPNFASRFLREMSSALNLPQTKPHGLPRGLTPEDIFHYAYAVFHSPGYRSRYAEFLKIDFPRLPLTGNLEMFSALAQLGSEIVSLHLMESPKLGNPITKLIGGRNPLVEKVSWSRNTVWVDKAKTTGFQGVPEELWNFHIGGYQVCEKWLKDRGPKKGESGRVLTEEDLTHYQKIVVALSETIRLMQEIDQVIDNHGGWPDAFSIMTDIVSES